MPKKRILFLDYAKGIGILLVALHHYGVPVIGKVILGFHMPLFFFLSGINSNTDKPPKEYIVKKIYTLIIPSLTMFVWDTSYHLIVGDYDGWSTIIRCFFNWFLWVLFYVSILHFTFRNVHKSPPRLCIMLLILMILFVTTQFIKLETPIHLEIIPMAMFFYELGHLFGQKVIAFKFEWRIMLISIPVLSVVSFINDPVLMYINEYGNVLLFCISATAGILTVIEVSKLFERYYENRIIKMLAFIGQNSLIIYILHFKIIVIVKYVIGLFSNNRYVLLLGYPIMIAMFFPIIMFCNRWLYFLFGKKKIVRKGHE